MASVDPVEILMQEIKTMSEMNTPSWIHQSNYEIMYKYSNTDCYFDGKL